MRRPEIPKSTGTPATWASASEVRKRRAPSPRRSVDSGCDRIGWGLTSMNGP